MKVTVNELMEIIKNLEVTTPNTMVGIKMRTLFRDDLKKSENKEINPYYKQVFKVSTKSYRLVTDYEKRVKNNLKKEGKNPELFQVESPKGKRHVSKSLLVDTQTESKLYVMVEWFPEVKGTTTYEFQGSPIDKVLFEKWISKSESSNKKQNLDREVKPITPELENILEFSIDGKKYEVVK
jgi:hypothetical protein